MRRLCATGLTVLLCVHPLLADGPLTRSADREAARLAAVPSRPVDADGWKAVRLLDPRSAIVVTIGDRTVSGAFVSLDDSKITVTRNGVTESINIDDVEMIEKRVRRGSALAAVFGTLGGIWLGTGMAFGLAESSRCYQHCGGVELAVWSSILGVPIAAGYGAWRSSSHMTEEVVYRRPSRARSCSCATYAAISAVAITATATAGATSTIVPVVVGSGAVSGRRSSAM